MRNPVPRFLFAVLVAAAAIGGAVAQEAASTPAEQALAAWQDAKGAKEKSAALQQLGRVDDPRVNALLLEELERAGNGAYAATVLGAIAQATHRELLPAMERTLLGGGPAQVQRAAARAIGRQGSQGIDLLLRVAGESGTVAALRAACLDGLTQAADDRAWRGLAALALQGDARERLEVLRKLEPVRDVSAVTRARLQLVDDGDEVLAAVAWRQLAAEGHARAEWKFEELMEGLGRRIDPRVAAEVIGGIPYVLDEEYYESFMRLAVNKNGQVRRALRDVAKRLGDDEDFTRWLVTSVLERGTPDERDVAMLVLRVAPPAAVKSLVDDVREGLRRADRRTLDLVVGMHDLLAKDPSWGRDLLQLAGSNDPAVRTVALSLMLEVAAPGAVEIAQKSLSHKSWELRSVAIRYLTKFRDLSSIPLLIARFEREEGRLDAELSDALFAHTGTRCWKKSEWNTWWRSHQDDHELPAAQTVQTSTKRGGGSTASYYGIPLSSKRISFLIDISGSMSAKVGTDGKRSRLDEAKRQLVRVVDQLDKDFDFNVIVYDTGVDPAWPELRRAAPKNKEEVRAVVEKLRPRGGTNIHDALELAFADPEVDTVYLLSDGAPSAGKITDPDDLADAVRRWNYQRQVTVHCISIGQQSKLLQRLAAESGGEYVFVP